jgi:aspartate racemase
VKRIGLIGGTSWESTLQYYRLVNQLSNRSLGGLDTAEVLLHSLNFGEVLRDKEASRGAPNDARNDARFVGTARALVAQGADLLAICSNTGHRRAELVQAAVDVPLVHIADATARAIRAAGMQCVALAGTLDTMEAGFYVDRMKVMWGITVLVPERPDRERVHSIALDEIAKGRRLEGSKADLARILRGLVHAGAQAAVLGCTELPLLLCQDDVPFPVFDTMTLHVEEILRQAAAV